MGNARRQQYVLPSLSCPLIPTPHLFHNSFLLGIPLPRHARVREEAHGLPVSKRGGHQVHCAGCAGCWEWDAALHTRWNRLHAIRKACKECFTVTDVS